nr:chitobiase/beta-hexosaminidase C-terminal domain-containing protein [uncultured Mediterraneibacter sp.]
MRCAHCGANIPDDRLICPECGTEVQMVPDYNPLDDVLTREVKGSVEDVTRPIRTDDIKRQRQKSQPQKNPSQNRNINSTRVLNEDEMERLRQVRRENVRRAKAQNQRQNTGQMRRSSGDPEQDAYERRRQQRVRQREAARKKRRNLLIVLFLLLVLIGVGIFVGYQNSYTGVIKKGNEALQAGDYSAAQTYFNRAIVKDKSRAEAYKGLSDVYADQDDLDGAESVYLTALETQPSNEKLYQAAIEFYLDNDQVDKISTLLEDCEDTKVLKAVQKYVSDAPTFSLEEGSYTEVQQVTISSSTGGTIYYTTDGTDPTTSSTKYTEAVLIQKEGQTEIRAIAVNAEGIPSAVASAEYTIEFPIEDAPAVSPSTGQYSSATQITITVPDGYTAYYTMDGSDPTSDSTRYEGPIDMPMGTTTVFNAILVNNQNGKATSVTTRTYLTTEG